MECLWSLLKRGLNGTYISVMPWHLCRYVDEQLFRFNERKMTDGQRFDVVMQRVLGKRLQYAELIGYGTRSPPDISGTRREVAFRNVLWVAVKLSGPPRWG